jgi:Ca2+-binding RTX toxin-like protein
MTKHVINDDQTTTFEISGDSDIWVAAHGTTLSGVDEPAVAITGNGNQFENIGFVRASNGQSEVLGYLNAIEISGDDTTIINHGHVRGDPWTYAIGGEGGSLNLTNWSGIRGRAALNYDAGDDDIKFINQKGGSLSTDSDTGIGGKASSLSGGDVIVINRGKIDGGIYLTGDTTSLTNDGTMSGGVISVAGTRADLINHGKIEHAFVILGGDMTFDGRTGTLDDVTLFGGTGDNVFQIDRALKITDEGGRDTIQAACTYKLADGSGIENLVLTGKKGFRAAGSDEDNHITGNSSDNRLSGGGGEDTLTGGKGHDEFVFNVNSGNDTITDFTDGIDKIHIDGYKFIKFSALEHRIEQDGHDVVITVSKDHTITLENFHARDLGAHDFLFS